MSSFKRRNPSTTRCPPGCSPSPSNSSLPLLSTGIPSLDDVLGGGIPLGSNLNILAPDEHSGWSKLLERYFIAQGLASGHDVIILGGEQEEPELRDLVRGCMWVDDSIVTAQTEVDSDGEGLEEDDGKNRIAWRYAKMKKFQTSVGGSKGGGGNNFSHALNLTTTLPPSLITHSESLSRLTYLTLSPSSSSPSSFTPLARMLESLQRILTERKVMYGEVNQKEGVRAIRVLVHDLGNLSWGENLSADQIHRFNRSLRSMIRDSLASSLTTYPPSLSIAPPVGTGRAGEEKGKGKAGQEERWDWLKGLGWGGDACIELQGFGNDPSLSISFPHSHGILHIQSLPTPHSLLPPSYRHSTLLGLSNGAGQNNLSFRVKRKRFVVETLHLGVEGGVGERRTGPGKGKGATGYHVEEGDGHGHSHGNEHSHEHSHDHAHEKEGVEPKDEKGRARMDIEIDESKELQQEDIKEKERVTTTRKKVVGWAKVESDKPQLYDF